VLLHSFTTNLHVVPALSCPGFHLRRRAIRVLRAVRLFKKSKSLKPLVEALFASVLPVCNSMSLLLLVTAIYASMAVVCHDVSCNSNSNSNASKWQ